MADREQKILSMTYEQSQTLTDGEKFLLRLTENLINQDELQVEDLERLKRVSKRILEMNTDRESIAKRRDTIIDLLGLKAARGRPMSNDSKQFEIAERYWHLRIIDDKRDKTAVPMLADEYNVDESTVRRAIKAQPDARSIVEFFKKLSESRNTRS